MYRTEAIILKKSDSGEADRIFTCYTKEFGKIKVLAKGARKAAGKLKYHLEPLTHSEISFVFGKNFSAEGGSASGRKILTGARSLNVFSSVKSDLNKLNLAFYFMGLLDDLAAGEEKDGKIWEHFAFSLESLEQAEAPDEIFSEKFVSNLLCHFGYLPNGGSYKDYREDLNKYLCRDLGRKYDFAVFKESEM